MVITSYTAKQLEVFALAKVRLEQISIFYFPKYICYSTLLLTGGNMGMLGDAPKE